MPKVKDATKHSTKNSTKDAVSAQQKHSQEPHCWNRNLEKLFRNFSKTHKCELKSTKDQMKHLSEEILKSQKIILNKNEIIESLKTKIDANEEEMKKSIVDKDNLSTEHKSLKQHFDELENKYASLENTYDKNLMEMRRTLEEYKEFCANHQELRDKFTSQSQELLAANKQLLEVQQNSEKIQKDMIEFQADFETYKNKTTDEAQTSSNDYETQITTLKEKLEQMEDLISKHQQEKVELEKAKNKIIEDQAYKIREIERVFDQPIKRVTPTANRAVGILSPAHNVAPLQVDVQEVMIAPNNSALAATSNAKSGLAVRAARRTAQPDEEIDATARWMRQNRSYIPPATELSTDDESIAGLSGWRPAFPNNNQPSEQLVMRSGISRKRPVAMDEAYIPETSGSDRFDNVKRPKK